MNLYVAVNDVYQLHILWRINNASVVNYTVSNQCHGHISIPLEAVNECRLNEKNKVNASVLL